jgi:hypothetical protein
VREGASHADVGERRKMLFVQCHVLVAVAEHLVQAQVRQRLDLAHFVPRHERDDVHLARLQLVDARRRIRDEAEE